MRLGFGLWLGGAGAAPDVIAPAITRWLSADARVIDAGAPLTAWKVIVLRAVSCAAVSEYVPSEGPSVQRVVAVPDASVVTTDWATAPPAPPIEKVTARPAKAFPPASSTCADAVHSEFVCRQSTE